MVLTDPRSSPACLEGDRGMNSHADVRASAVASVISALTRKTQMPPWGSGSLGAQDSSTLAPQLTIAPCADRTPDSELSLLALSETTLTREETCLPRSKTLFPNFGTLRSDANVRRPKDHAPVIYGNDASLSVELPSMDSENM
jgi:hypothetical protein